MYIKRESKNRAVFNDWGLYTFIQMLTTKCRLYGKGLQFLDECYTFNICCRCCNLQAMPLCTWTYSCVDCGLFMDRDQDGAVNILMRFLDRPGRSHEADLRVVRERFHRS